LRWGKKKETPPEKEKRKVEGRRGTVHRREKKEEFSLRGGLQKK